MPSDLRTRAIVLRRTNYGESDRILNLITETGKTAVLARGVRKEKSRLAGSIELFSIADITIHQGRSSLGVLTSAKMLRFFSQLLNDLPRLELASELLKQIDRASEQISSPEHFSLLSQSLAALNTGISPQLVRTWFLLNLQRVGGEDLNLICDSAGQALDPEQKYVWDNIELALRPDAHGVIGASEIKFARFLLQNSLARTAKINNFEAILAPLQPLTSQ